MHNLHAFSALALLLLAALLNACNGDDDGDGGTGAGPGGEQGDVPTLTHVSVDEDLNFLLSSGDELNVPEHRAIALGDTLVFESDVTVLSPGRDYAVEYRGESATLYRTPFPVLELDPTGVVEDAAKVPATFAVAQPGSAAESYSVGVEYRGDGQDLAKPTYTFELRESLNSSEEISAPLLGLRDDDDWVLDGMDAEPSSVRDYGAHELWLGFGRTPMLPAGARGGIGRRYVELFVSGSYRGIYYLAERYDRKQLQLTRFDNGMQGELYEGDSRSKASSFRIVEAFDNTDNDWSGFEAIYPSSTDDLDWQPLYDFVDWVVNATDQDFAAELTSRVDLDNVVDYFLFVNLLDASDNMAKNLYTARQEANAPYYFLPYDLNGILGLDADGNRVSPTTDIHVNGLYERLLAQPAFTSALRARWAEASTQALSVDNVADLFEQNITRLAEAGAYQRQNLRSAVPAVDSPDDEAGAIRDAAATRWALLDAYIDTL